MFPIQLFEDFQEAKEVVVSVADKLEPKFPK